MSGSSLEDRGRWFACIQRSVPNVVYNCLCGQQRAQLISECPCGSLLSDVCEIWTDC